MKVYDLAILGRGTGGLFLADSLSDGDSKIKACVIGNNYGNSALSPWNIRTKIDDKVLSILERCNDSGFNLLKKEFINDYDKKVEEFLYGLNLPLIDNSFGVRIGIKCPGKKILGRIESKIENKIDIIKSRVIDIVNINGLYNIILKTNTEINNIVTKKVVIASGGQGNKFELSTGVKSRNPDIIDIIEKLGVKSFGLDNIMFHPFMVKTPSGRFKLISGDLITSFIYFKEDIKGNKTRLFPYNIQSLINKNDYHHIFDIMKKYVLNAENNGYTIIGENKVSAQEYRKIALNNEFGHIIKQFNDNELKKVCFKPGYHYMLGGIKVDDNLQSTSNKDFYAIGESVGGFFNGNRPAGMGHSDSIILAPKLADIILNS